MSIKIDKYHQWSKKLSSILKEHSLEIIYLEITRNCDMSCIHCGSPSETWEKEKELSTHEVINVFKEIAVDFDLSKFKFVCITGGEPFVRKDLLYLLESISNLGFEPITIQTNGNALARDPELIEKLIERGVRGIGTNIDGLEYKHDEFRNRKGHYRSSILATKHALERRDLIHTTVSTVITRKNIGELEELNRVIRILNPHRWRLIFLDPIGRGAFAKEYLLSPEEVKNVINFIQKQRLMYIDRKDLTQIELGCGGWLGCEIEGKVRPYIYHCVAGINTLGILYDGGIAACSNIPRAFIEGNIRTDKILEVWNKRYSKFREYDWKRIGDCVNCSEWEYCHGGPMHKRLPNGEMLDCLYKIIKEGKDYRREIPQEAYNTLTGN